MKIALHTCCGPCLIEPFDALVEEAEHVVAVFFNPNIHPAEEYVRRRETLSEYARGAGIEVVEIAYDPALWHAEVAPYFETPAERCRHCYALRLSEVARWAAENGFDAVTTTLTVSPYQDEAAISQEGHRAAEKAGTIYLDRDYRDRYRSATERSRALEMYRQNYCGCVISQSEAQQQREERKKRKKAGER